MSLYHSLLLQNVLSPVFDRISPKDVQDFVNSKGTIDPLFILETTSEIFNHIDRDMMNIYKLTDATINKSNSTTNKIIVEGKYKPFFGTNLIESKGSATFLFGRTCILIFRVELSDFKLSNIIPFFSNVESLNVKFQNSFSMVLMNAKSSRELLFPGLNFKLELNLKDFEFSKTLRETLNINIEHAIVTANIGYITNLDDLKDLSRFLVAGRLSAETNDLIHVCDEFGIKDVMAALTLEKADENHTSLSFELECNMELRVTEKPVEIKATLNINSDGSFKSKGRLEKWENFLMDGLSIEEFEMEFEMDSQKHFSASIFGIVKCPTGTIIQVAGCLSKTQTSYIYGSVDNFTIGELFSLYNMLFNGNLKPLEHEVIFKNVSVSYSTDAVSTNGITIPKGFCIHCEVSIPGVIEGASATLELSSEGVHVQITIEKFDSSSLLSDDHTAFSSLPHNEAFSIDKAYLYIDIVKEKENKISSFKVGGLAKVFGFEIEVSVESSKNSTTLESHALVYGKLHSDTKLKEIVTALKGTFVEDITFRELYFTYCSSSKPGNDEHGSLPFQVQKGISIIAVMDNGNDKNSALVSGSVNTTKLQKLNTIDSNNSEESTVFTFNYSNSNWKIGLQIPGFKLNLNERIITDPLMMWLEFGGVGISFDIQLGFRLKVDKPRDEFGVDYEFLHFIGMLSVGSDGLVGSFNMLGWWRNAFGINGVDVGDELGISIGLGVTGLSELGFAAGISIRSLDLKMSAAMSISSHLLLVVNIEKLTSNSLIKMIGCLVGQNIDTSSIPEIFSIEDAQFYFAPNGGRIGVIEYDKGVSFRGFFSIFGLNAYIEAKFFDDGFSFFGIMREFNLGPLTVGSKPSALALQYLNHPKVQSKANFITKKEELGPIIELQLTKSKQRLYVNGMMDLFGMTLEVEVLLSKEKISFEIDFNAWDLFRVYLLVESMGETTNNLLPSQLHIKAIMKNDLQIYLITVIKSGLNTAIENVEKSFDDALKAITTAQQEFTDDKIFDELKEKKTERRLSFEKIKDEQQSKAQQALELLESSQQHLKKAECLYKEGIKEHIHQLDVFLDQQEKELNTVIEDCKKTREFYQDLDVALTNVKDTTTIQTELIAQAEQLFEEQALIEFKQSVEFLSQNKTQLCQVIKIFTENNNPNIDGEVIVIELKKKIQYYNDLLKNLAEKYTSSFLLMEQLQNYNTSINTEIQMMNINGKRKNIEEAIQNLYITKQKTQEKVSNMKKEWKSLDISDQFEQTKKAYSLVQDSYHVVIRDATKLIEKSERLCILEENYLTFCAYRIRNGLVNVCMDIAKVVLEGVKCITKGFLIAIREVLTGILSCFGITYINLESTVNSKEFLFELTVKGFIFSVDNTWEFTIENVDLRNTSDMGKKVFDNLWSSKIESRVKKNAEEYDKQESNK